MKDNKFTSTFGYKLIYVFRINDNNHKGIVKIGDATIHYEEDITNLKDNCPELNESAINRINQYTKTAGISFELLYSTLAIDNNGQAFRDYQVHKLLKRSGIEKIYLNNNNRNEWFKIDLETAIKAINAIKEGRISLNSNEITFDKDPIILRPEQEEAIKKTIKNYETSNRMLWNAKPRFGKTVCALEIVKRKQYKRTIILTHRPVVDDGWYDDFKKIFNESDYYYGSKNKGETIEKLLKKDCNFVYFASIQDLRGSKEVGGSFEKNELIFNTDWDFVVIDEAHEGTKTYKGEKTIEGVVKLSDDYTTKLLELSGTPFNLLADYEEKEIYTWDYVMEQSAKLEWEEKHDGDSNPYEDLPRMNIFTYDLNKQFKGYIDLVDKSFNFREFFRTWTGDIEVDRKEMPNDVEKGSFIYQEDVIKFLDLLTLDYEKTNYPYSKQMYREYFRHSLWMVPGVKEAKALSKLLKQHSVFGSGVFKIVNVAGDGDEENTLKSKHYVDSAITNHPENTYTITLSCGRLTTGVTIPAWTAVFMLNGGNSTSASSYLQTIFRVQTPANIGGKIKDKCYVFDFAPDRALKMLAEAGQLSCKAGSIDSRTKMGDLLNYCSVISVDGSSMIPYSVDTMLRTLKKAYADKVVDNGFDDSRIYNDMLLKLDGLEIEKFNQLQGIIGVSKRAKTLSQIEINKQGFTDEEWETTENDNKKKKKQLTDEEKQIQEKEKEKRNQRYKAISILRGISIRIPLLVYGADLKKDEELTIDNITDIVDDKSWEEFMPRGVTKDIFKDFSKYYDSEIFVEAGNRIRNITKYADTLSPLERVKEIVNLFATFKNPDKETVLTPWKTVNMHMGDTIGGYNFYDEKYIVTIEEPRLILNGEVTIDVLNNINSKVLELNSKTGLYPLYVTYSIFRQRCLNTDAKKLDEELEKALWEATLSENIFVVTKTKMAKSITNRTLAGYNNFKTNIIEYENLIDELTTSPEKFKSKILNSLNWEKKEGENMKFNAIVGNPPYQESDGGAFASAKPLYNLFVDAGIKLQPNYISLIMPSRWMTGGKGLDVFRSNMINDKRFLVLHDYFDARECFSNVEIKGGVCYFLWGKENLAPCSIYTHFEKDKISKSYRYLKDSENDEIFIRDNNQISVKNKIDNFNFISLVSSLKPYGLRGDVFKDTSKYNLPSFDDEKNDNMFSVIGLNDDNKRVIKYANKNYPFPKKDMIDKYKLFVTRNYGNGTLGEKPSNIILASPYDVCTETFIQIGPFDTKEEASNCLKYMNTKFFRFLVGIQKHDQGASKTIYKYVPIQDFTEKSDIDWSEESIKIDQQLYEKYKISKEEEEYIESNIPSIF